jgi:hypothetical protein
MSWKERKNGGSELLKCDCVNTFQDNVHGAGMRVHNIGGKDKGKKATCTGCGKVKT